MSDDLKVVSQNGASYVVGSTAIAPKGEAGWNVNETNFRPYVLPGEDYKEKPNKIETPEFVIAPGKKPPGCFPLTTPPHLWEPALLPPPIGVTPNPRGHFPTTNNLRCMLTVTSKTPA